MSYKIWASPPLTEPQISCAGVSVITHFSATENTPTVTGLTLWFFGGLVFYNLGFIFNQLDFSLSPSKETEAISAGGNESCMPKVGEGEKGWLPWLPYLKKNKNVI